jgi:hypothetical protein
MKNKITILLSSILLMGFAFQASAQESKVDPRIDLTYYQVDNELPYVKVLVRKRVERRFYPLINIPLDIYFNDEDDESKMGSIVTNAKGEGKVTLPEALREAWNALSEFEVLAVLASSDTINEATESIFIKRARLQLETEDVKGRVITAKVEEKTDDEWLPVADAEVKVFVYRHFGKLPVGDDFYTSDEEGLIEAGFAEELPGDKDGMILLGGMLEEHEEFGTIVTHIPVKWGVPLKDAETFNKRTLWSTRDKTPWWLLIFPNLIIAGIWGVIVYLVWSIIKIKKLAGKVH